jgi:hypothetical protein
VAAVYRWLDKSVYPGLHLVSSVDLDQPSVSASVTFPK